MKRMVPGTVRVHINSLERKFTECQRSLQSGDKKKTSKHSHKEVIKLRRL